MHILPDTVYILCNCSPMIQIYILCICDDQTMSTYTMQYMNAANTICALMTLYLINSTSMHKLYMCGICTAHAIYAICFNIYLSVSGASFPNLLGSPLTSPPLHRITPMFQYNGVIPHNPTNSTNPTTITTFTLTLLFYLLFF